MFRPSLERFRLQGKEQGNLADVLRRCAVCVGWVELFVGVVWGRVVTCNMLRVTIPESLLVVAC